MEEPPTAAFAKAQQALMADIRGGKGLCAAWIRMADSVAVEIRSDGRSNGVRLDWNVDGSHGLLELNTLYGLTMVGDSDEMRRASAYAREQSIVHFITLALCELSASRCQLDRSTPNIANALCDVESDFRGRTDVFYQERYIQGEPGGVGVCITTRYLCAMFLHSTFVDEGRQQLQITNTYYVAGRPAPIVISSVYRTDGEGWFRLIADRFVDVAHTARRHMLGSDNQHFRRQQCAVDCVACGENKAIPECAHVWYDSQQKTRVGLCGDCIRDLSLYHLAQVRHLATFKDDAEDSAKQAGRDAVRQSGNGKRARGAEEDEHSNK
jgi:hypothetical protein